VTIVDDDITFEVVQRGETRSIMVRAVNPADPTSVLRNAVRVTQHPGAEALAKRMLQDWVNEKRLSMSPPTRSTQDAVRVGEVSRGVPSPHTNG